MPKLPSRGHFKLQRAYPTVGERTRRGGSPESTRSGADANWRDSAGLSIVKAFSPE